MEFVVVFLSHGNLEQDVDMVLREFERSILLQMELVSEIRVNGRRRGRCFHGIPA